MYNNKQVYNKRVIMISKLKENKKYWIKIIDYLFESGKMK